MSGERRGGSALRAWVGSFGTNVFLLFVGIATGIIGARVLGPEGRGALAEVLFWGGFVAQLALVGLPTAVTIEAARTSDPARLIVTATVLALGYALVAAGAFWLVSDLFVSAALAGLTLAYGVAYLPANLVGLALSAVDRGRQRFGLYNAMRVIPQLTYLGGTVLILATGTDAVAPFVWASLLGSALVVAARAISMRDAFTRAPSLSVARRLVVSGAQLHLQPVIGTFQQSGDRLLILAFLDQSALGFYAVALTFAGAAIKKVSSATVTILLPKAVAADEQARGGQLATALSSTFVVSLALNGALAAACPVLIPLLFGQAFAAAVPAAVLLCLAQVGTSVLNVLATGLRSYGDWTSGPLATAVSLVVFLLVAIATLHHLEITGVALGLLVGKVVGSFVVLRRAMARTGLPLNAFVVPPRWLFSPGSLRARLGKPG